MRRSALFALTVAILLPVSALATRPELPRADCTALAERMLRAGRLPGPVRNAEEFLTWRASCAEAPPRGPGPVRLLCEGEYEPRPGTTGRVFYWEKIDGGRFPNGATICRRSPR